MRLFRFLVPGLLAALTAACGDTPRDQTTPGTGGSGGGGANLNDPAAIMPLSQGVLSQNGAFVVKVDWSQQPTVNQYMTATLTFADAQRHFPHTLGGVTFLAWLPSTGDSAAQTGQRQVIVQPNVIRIEPVDLVASGTWTIRVGATVNGYSDTALVSVVVP